jgi:hypothetical protein
MGARHAETITQQDSWEFLYLVFAFRFTPSYRRAGLPFGVTPGRAWARVADGRLEVRFGRWRVGTPLANVAGVEVTGPYAFLKTAGPAHLAVTDRGLTFATNGDRGVCLRFHEPVTGIEPFGIIRHPTLTLTVADVDGFIRALGPLPAGGS